MAPPLILPNVTIGDFSHWDPQTEPDFATAHAAGMLGVIVKFTQNGKPDPAAIQISYNAFEAGITLLGGYDFGTPVDDAAAFLAQIGSDYQGNLSQRLIMLDAERNSPQMTVPEAEQWVQDIFNKEGRYPTLYMGRSGPDGTGKGLPSPTLSKCDLMLAAYGPHGDNLGAVLPPGFRLPTSDTDQGGVLRLWQFTDGSINGGAFPGVGKVDQSYAIGFSSVEAFTAWWGS